MELRKAEMADLELLRDFAEHTFRVAYEAMNEPETFNDYCREAFSLDKFREELADENSGFWLYWIEGQLAAYLKLNFDQPTETIPEGKMVQVERIYVESTFQGHGLGAELLVFSQEQAALWGADWIWLSVWTKNPRAVKFYENCGYENCGIEIFQLGDDPQEDWVMRKKV